MQSSFSEAKPKEWCLLLPTEATKACHPKKHRFKIKMQGLDETEKHDSAFIDTNWIPKMLLYTAIIAATVEGT